MDDTAEVVGKYIEAKDLHHAKNDMCRPRSSTRFVTALCTRSYSRKAMN